MVEQAPRQRSLLVLGFTGAAPYPQGGDTKLRHHEGHPCAGDGAGS